MIEENAVAPDFILISSENKSYHLAEKIGKPIILYFYPKDDTPGCTTEACGFRDNFSAYQELGAEIIGISPDNEISHKKFIQKFELPFLLLADPDHEVCNLYGVWGRKKFMGREFDGVYRTTFLINKEGKIAKVFKGVKPVSHSLEVLESVKKIL